MNNVEESRITRTILNVSLPTMFLLVCNIVLSALILYYLLEFSNIVNEKFDKALNIVDDVNTSLSPLRSLYLDISDIANELESTLNDSTTSMSRVIIQNVQSLNTTLNSIASKLSIFLPG